MVQHSTLSRRLPSRRSVAGASIVLLGFTLLTGCSSTSTSTPDASRDAEYWANIGACISNATDDPLKFNFIDTRTFLDVDQQSIGILGIGEYLCGYSGENTSVTVILQRDKPSTSEFTVTFTYVPGSGKPLILKVSGNGSQGEFDVKPKTDTLVNVTNFSGTVTGRSISDGFLSVTNL